MLADSGKCRDVSPRSPMSEILQFRRHNQHLGVASNRAVETFGSLPRSTLRRKPPADTRSRRSRNGPSTTTRYDSIKGVLIARSTRSSGLFGWFFCALLFAGVGGVQGRCRRGERERFGLPEAQKSGQQRGLKSSLARWAWGSGRRDPKSGAKLPGATHSIDSLNGECHVSPATICSPSPRTLFSAS